ncbi:hypothetical protein [Streptomyces sp. CC208A]|uniref:DUF3592 domain-containing protein n=1 Tax=Streptomyces sp. CC208A TaxID=3044573 RepID=UPI0024A8FDCF|nr:hypothetical protein [Streptomyces sp. CC208A]
MSLTSPIPVLQGNKGAALRSEGESLILSRPHEELDIPLAAIERVRAEGRSVAVELTAPAGATAVVHRVEGVSEVAATVFADLVNAALPERGEDDARADGSSLVTVRVLSGAGKKTGMPVLLGWAAALVLVANGVATGVAAGGLPGVFLGVISPLVGGMGLAAAGGGAGWLWLAYLQWHLPRYGITVTARRIADRSRLLGGSGTHMYTDSTGVSRTLYSKARSETVQVAYDPRNPMRAIVRQSRPRTAWDATFALGLLCFGLALIAMVVAMTVGAFQGAYDDAGVPQ